MASALPATALAAYNSRDRIMRDEGGSIHFFWGTFSIRMTQGEFLNLAGLLEDAVACQVRRGELARCPCGRVARCAMGQIALSHRSFTLWFSPKEFEKLYQLVNEACRRLADAAPLPQLGLPWATAHQGCISLN
jgi:hypothetical protein